MTATRAVGTVFGGQVAVRRRLKPTFRALKPAVCALMVVALAGCGSSNLLGPSDTPSVAANPQGSTQASPALAPVVQSRVALAPVMGAPDAVGKNVAQQLNAAMERQRVVIAPAGEKPDYTLRGYIVATKERTSTKVSYIFDLTDPAGKRVNRIQGEEMAPAEGSDPWASVTPEIAQRISDKTATALSSALSSLTPSSSTGSAPASAGVASVAAAPPAAVGMQTAAASTTAGSTTGSIDRSTSTPDATNVVLATVPVATGAPGDGNTSLPAAMRQELQQSGLGTPATGQKAYGVAGKVTMGTVKDGKQPIKIEWRVTDVNGAHLATVAQNNEIQAGALDGNWGAVASDAAQGAAPKIKAIIEENRATGGTRSRQASRTKG